MVTTDGLAHTHQQMDCVNATTKSAQHAHARMIVIFVEKSKLMSFVRFHGCNYYTNCQAVKN